MLDFPKAVQVERGCGDREPGGVYVECGLSPYGRPLEEFLIDPSLPVPAGWDLVNKPQARQRFLPSGEPALDDVGLPIYDLLIWVGEQYYPFCPDYIEETRRYGVSRRLNPNLDLSLLSQSSRMILAHPLARNTAWQEQQSPERCEKGVPGHAATDAHSETVGKNRPPEIEPTGPCLFQLWNLIPQEAAHMILPEQETEQEETIPPLPVQSPLCLRSIGSTIYHYRPSGEATGGLSAGFFATFPITGFAFIRFHDGSVNERAKEKVLAGLTSHGDRAIPFYESDR